MPSDTSGLRILVVGAGAIGGYFGARLAAAGRDVTFLVRPKRREQLHESGGLVVLSPCGDLTITAPRLVTEVAATDPFDVILLSCKSFDLNAAIASFAAAVGPRTMVLPLLNGMAHLQALRECFAGAVLGGLCQISVTLDDAGRVLHLNGGHLLTFGELDAADTARIRSLQALLDTGGFDARLSRNILQDMWEKWVFIASLAGITCLLRASIGDIQAAGVGEAAVALYNECAAIATRNGYAPAGGSRQRTIATLTASGSALTASMLRDVEGHKRTEHEHILGDLLARSDGHGVSLLEMCVAHMRAYEARRLREELSHTRRMKSDGGGSSH